MNPPTIVVMAGPSLPSSTRPELPGAVWLPPAVAGDIAALLDRPPKVLCLIDGLFDTSPAPWHKELMLLMAAGTAVYGASSMGALRAAELDRHGMTGVGAIYAAYRSGRLTGDDEVALIHATERLDWAPLSVPLVEVRATLIAAVRARLVRPDEARRIRVAAADIHYAERDWPALRAALARAGLCDEATARALERLHVPLKRRDALHCLRVAATGLGTQRPVPPPPPITYFLTELLDRRGVSR